MNTRSKQVEEEGIGFLKHTNMKSKEEESVCL
jgi:hypothetical protein